MPTLTARKRVNLAMRLSGRSHQREGGDAVDRFAQYLASRRALRDVGRWMAATGRELPPLEIRVTDADARRDERRRRQRELDAILAHLSIPQPGDPYPAGPDAGETRRGPMFLLRNIGGRLIGMMLGRNGGGA